MINFVLYLFYLDFAVQLIHKNGYKMQTKCIWIFKINVSDEIFSNYRAMLFLKIS